MLSRDLSTTARPKVTVTGEDIFRLIGSCEAALLWAGRSIKCVKKFAAECHECELEADVMTICELYCELVWKGE